MYDLCVRVAFLLALAACGRIRFDARPLDAAVDVAADSACTWSAFSTPQRLPAIVQTTADDWFASPSLGGTEIDFYSYRGGAPSKIMYTPTDPYAVPVARTELTSGTNDLKWPSLSDDGLDIIYDVYNGAVFELWEGTRASTGDLFSSLTRLASVDTTAETFSASLSADGLRMLYSSDVTGPELIYEVTRATRASPFTLDTVHSELAAVGGDLSVTGTLSADGLDIFFASKPAGDFKIYTAHRTVLGGAFGPPQVVPELDSAGDDIGPHLSLDGTTLYMNYNTISSGGADADLYAATRTCN